MGSASQVDPASLGTVVTFPGGAQYTQSPVEAVKEDTTSVLVRLLDLKHPEYEARFESWLDLGLLYEGGSALKARAERVLKKRPREDEEVFASRMDNFTYQNILGTALGWYGAAMFDKDPEFFFGGKAGDATWTNFLSNCDGVGSTYADFFKRVFQVILTYGSGWVLTDLKPLGEGEDPPLTREDEKTRGLLDPHVACYNALNVINWQTDEVGQLLWAVVKVEEQRQAFLSQPQLVSTWYYYDRQQYRVYEDVRSPEEQIRVATDDSGRLAKFVRGGKHALAHVSRLPLRRLLLGEGLWLANRAYLLLLDHLNQDNAYKWALFMSCLAIPVVIGDFDANQMTQSEVGFLQFPEGVTYQWSEPDGKSFTHASKRVESLREESYRSMHLQAQGRSMRATPAMQSGFSKQLDMAPAKQILTGMGDDLRKHMQDILCDVMDARHIEEDPDVRGFSFQEDMSTEEVFAASSVINLRVPSRKFEKHMFRRIAKAWMPDVDRKDLVEVYNEINAAPTIEEREEEEFRKQVKVQRQNLHQELSARGGPEMPPGRGGAGSPPPAEKK